MSKIKEKKLNSIKSEMEEIRKYITSNGVLDNPKQKNTNLSNNYTDDTLTLTKIVRENNKIIYDKDLDQIKKDLLEIKSSIDSNRNLLQEILLKMN